MFHLSLLSATAQLQLRGKLLKINTFISLSLHVSTPGSLNVQLIQMSTVFPNVRLLLIHIKPTTAKNVGVCDPAHQQPNTGPSS